MSVIQIIAIVLLVVGFGLMFTSAGRMLFDVALLVCLILVVAGVLK